MCILHLHGRSPRDAKAILAAFSNAFNKHMLACEFHLCSLSFVFLRYVLLIHYYLSCVNCFIYLFEFFLDRVEKVSIKPSKVQERGIQTSVQNAKYNVQHRFISPVSKVQKRCRSIYNNWSTNAGGFSNHDISYESHTRYLISNLSPLWAVYGYSESLTRLTTKLYRMSALSKKRAVSSSSSISV